ncbi:MAG: 4Fe-4S binding protein [Oxalobacteraceae bacterium]|nr:4Fe-4S binding protein [Oxalobacteraceae bacterium]
MKIQIHPVVACSMNTSFRCPSVALLWRFLCCLSCLLSASAALAGVMTRDQMVKIYPLPYVVGEKDTALPVWPIFQQDATENRLVGYAFESIDLAPIPGFSGVPINLLIALDTTGNFLDVRVLSQHEPVFLDGLGEAPLHSFVGQYTSLSLKQSIRILTGSNAAKNTSAETAQLDGVSKATASVRIINQSILSAALKVARKKLGFAEGRDPELIARIKPDVSEPHTVRDLIDAGLIKHLLLRNAEVEKKFIGSNGSGLDADAIAHPQDPFIELYIAYVSVPSIGRNLLRETAWNRLQGRLEPGDHAILVMSKGRYSIIGDDFIRGSTPDRIALKQDRLPIEMRDLNLDLALKSDQGAALDMESVSVFRIISQAGLDPSRPLDFVLPVTRYKGMIYPEKISRDFSFSFKLPARFYTVPESDNKSWGGIWRDRQGDIAVLVTALALLSLALTLQKKLVAQQRRFAVFRNLYLLFTLFFIGWYAQGQLSIVNFTGVLQALIAGRSLSFFLYDPMTVILSAFVCVSLVIWGRGTFCGWLCPFGALQEFTAKLGTLLKVPQVRLKPITDSRLKRIKYLLLAGILGSTFFASSITDKLVELEPFKTAITLNFVRSWPFVAYALGLLVAGMFVYKFFCRFLCPFGAGLAVLGRLRMLDWIPRRKECGTPCQTCRHQCAYQAIAPAGKIDYDECFQCMECVLIHASDERCAPLMLEKKRARVIPIRDLTTGLASDLIT